MGLRALLVSVITLYEGVIIVRVLLSWFSSPYSTHPLVEWIHRVTDPVLEPVQRVLPSSGGIDLSPLVVLVGLELVKRLIL